MMGVVRVIVNYIIQYVKNDTLAYNDYLKIKDNMYTKIK